MTKQRKQLKKIGILFGTIFTIFVLLILNGLWESNQDADYYAEADLKLSGIITKVKPLTVYGHDYGVIEIDISISNKRNYDVRKDSKRYLGVVKGKKAALVFSSISSVKEGDSLILDVQNYSIYRQRKLIRKSVVGMPPKSFLSRPFSEINKKINL